ncbi:DNA-binding response regulator [Aggregatibacter actinomycetemcomitans]|uniref:DNA-binding response regulator n=1 Tax=Aggregatibacter actinomycetemcomitans TaxID=714 RepID=A0A2G1DRM0_AGGAC|nr:DNA-binding response regulator [Aggregatibacter actinomycetemcomitans]
MPRRSLEGFQVNVANNGKEALELLDHSYDLILLDIMMPVLNGIETLKQISIDRILGLELGADDYLPKPFNDRELVARIKAILRRTAQANNAKDPTDVDKIEFGGIVFYPGRQQAMLGSKDLELTGTEFALLLKLITHPGLILTREELSLEVLGKPLTPFDRAIDMHMSNLRKKLPARSDDLPWFKTLRGRGYLLIAEK